MPRPQIYVLRLDGGEVQAVMHLKNGASGFQWSPDSRRFVVVSRTRPSDGVAPTDRKSDVRHYKHIHYEFNDAGRFDDKRSHLWTVDVATGAEKQLTSGDDWSDTDHNGRLTGHALRSSPTAPARNTKAATTRTSG
jgi:dipeptidyl aminopeptidase/acylaminoacyl peptidase